MTEYLLTGVTGGLGSVVLSTLLSSGVPASSITCTSTNASNSTRFTSQNLKFVQLDFNDATKLAAAFQGVRNLFFVSTNTFNAEERVRQHTNVILAAKQAGVGHVWYTSLAFGGRTGQSKVDVQQAHLVTERLMREHLGGEEGTKWTSVREGLYIDAFPLWLNWYPTDRKQVLYLPDDGGRGVAWATREELGEATAKLMLKGGEENRIVGVLIIEKLCFIFGVVAGTKVQWENRFFCPVLRRRPTSRLWMSSIPPRTGKSRFKPSRRKSMLA